MDEKLIQSRIDFEKMGENYPVASGVVIEKQTIEDIACYWFKKPGTEPHSKIIIYLHGGCFVFGSVFSHRALVSHLAHQLELPILFIEYSLAPEKPYPAALHEILDVYTQLQTNYAKSDFIIMGDSAGGWLSVALIAELYRLGLQTPTHCILLSPWMDLTCSYNSIRENEAIDPILNKDRLMELASLYITASDLSKFNPAEAAFDEFPATLILVGSQEILLDDSRLFHNKIKKVQDKVTLSIYENKTHVWLLDEIESEQSQKTIQEILTFLDL